MKIFAVHPITGDVQPIDHGSVRFVTDDGVAVFEASIGADGASIKVRALDSFKVAGVLYEGRLTVEPNVSNSITIRAREWRLE